MAGRSPSARTPYTSKCMFDALNRLKRMSDAVEKALKAQEDFSRSKRIEITGDNKYYALKAIKSIASQLTGLASGEDWASGNIVKEAFGIAERHIEGKRTQKRRKLLL